MVKPVKKLLLRKAASKTETKPDHLGPTERRWMAWKAKDRMFDMLTVMAEDNNPAFDILMEVFTIGADPLFHEIATALDDMNIRGEQIVLGYDFCQSQRGEPPKGTPVEKFIAAVRARDPYMIQAINGQWKKAFMERAVPSGAHKWMHKKIITPPNG